MSKHARHVAYIVRTLAWQAKVGLILIAIGLLLLATLVQTEAQHVDALNKDYTNIKRQKASKPVEPAPVFSADEQFYAVLPTQQQVNANIAQILEKANDNGLLVEKADYATPTSSSALLHKQQIRLPVNGSYTQIRSFINQVLNSQPNLALSEVNFKRDDIGTDLVSSNILFTLYLK